MLTGVAKELAYKTWHNADKLITLLRDQTKFDMKASDDKYHILMKTGDADASRVHKYTDAAVDLLRKVRDGEEYKVDEGKVDADKIAAEAAKK